MRIEKLEIDNYRNIKHAELFPSEGINVIYGKNAQGKTNLLEAICMCLNARSHRESVRANFVGESGESALVSADLAFEDETKSKLSMRLAADSRRYTLDKIAVKSRAMLLKSFPVVFFSPEDLSLVKNGASERRAFMDEACCILFSGYAAALSGCNTLLRQRSALLRERRADFRLLSVYDEKLSALGCRIMRARVRFLREFEPHFANIYAKISGAGEKLSVNYVSSLFAGGIAPITEEGYIKMLLSSRNEDMRLCSTQKGVHRDDVLVLLDKRPARKFASQGQCRSLALAMKLSLPKLIIEQGNSAPVVLLDDVMSELDEGRRANICALLSEGMQCFISGAEDNISDFAETNRYLVSGGTFTKTN